MTPTQSSTPTETYTPSITPTPQSLCIVIVSNPEAINLRSEPAPTAERVTFVQNGQVMEVIERSPQRGQPSGPLWYRVRAVIGDSQREGWVRSDLVSEVPSSPCPPLPQ